MDKISIIVPVYNMGKYLSRCVDSLIQQTYSNIEIILVNDGSIDNSGLLCDSYAKKDSRIVVIHKLNGGLSDARNIGLEVATGEYVGFVDSDDYIDKDMYESLYYTMKDHNTYIGVCGRYNVTETSISEQFTLYESEKWSNKESVRRLLLWDGIDSSACDKLFHHSLFKDKKFPYGKNNEDIFLIPFIIDSVSHIVHIGKPKYYYYQRDGSITSEQFNLKKMDLLEANQIIFDGFINKYPTLRNELVYFKAKGLVYLNIKILSSDYKIEFRDEFRKLYRLLLKNFFS